MLIFAILWPTFALVALVFAVWITVAVKRLSFLRRTPPPGNVFATGDEMRRYFAPVELANDNLVNLLQLPVLYFALVPLLLMTRQADAIEVALAWTYVLLRGLHSVLHIWVKHVRARFLVHVASNAVLSAMWIGFFVDMVAVAHVYHEALRAFGPHA